MIKPEVVMGLLASLREQVANARTFQKYSLKELTEDFVLWNALLHLLQVSVEHVTDIGAHLLAGSGKTVPDKHSLILRRLGEVRILPYDFAQRIAPMASFRNIIVHHYLTIDPQKVGNVLYNQLSDFDDFALYITDYLQREGYLKEEE